MNIDEEYLKKRIEYFKKFLIFDPLWEFDIKIYDLDDVPDEYKTRAAFVDLNSAEYFKAEISFNSYNIPNKSYLDEVIIHELLHILFYPISSFLSSSVNEKYEDYSSKLEESFIHRLTQILSSIKLT